MVEIETSTLVYISDTNSIASPVKTIDVNQVGFYFYNGSKWTKLSLSNLSFTNAIKNENGLLKLGGTLTENTEIITTTDHKLAVKGNFENNFSVGTDAFSVNSKDKKVGIGTIAPTNTLDVNGKLRVRNTDIIPANQAEILYVNADGVIGKSDVNGYSPKTYFSESRNPIDVTSDFNSANLIVLPIETGNITLNTLNMSPTNGVLTVSETGIYQISGSLNMAIRTNSGTGEAATQKIFLAINIQKSTDGGSNWASISGIRPIILQDKGINLNNTFSLPTTLVNLSANNKLRMVIYRT